MKRVRQTWRTELEFHAKKPVIPWRFPNTSYCIFIYRFSIAFFLWAMSAFMVFMEGSLLSPGSEKPIRIIKNKKGIWNLRNAQHPQSSDPWSSQIIRTLRFHLTPGIMTKIKKPSDSSCWQGCGLRTLIRCWWECKRVQAPWTSVCWVLRKRESSTSNSSCTTLGTYQ